VGMSVTGVHIVWEGCYCCVLRGVCLVYITCIKRDVNGVYNVFGRGVTSVYNICGCMTLAVSPKRSHIWFWN
jgi:hypothetical protein